MAEVQVEIAGATKNEVDVALDVIIEAFRDRMAMVRCTHLSGLDHRISATFTPVARA